MLKICAKVFDSFNKNSINYAIIKSVEHKEFVKAINGLKDIDLLIAEKDREISERILCDLGFKKVFLPKRI